jgi:hypothetical protein
MSRDCKEKSPKPKRPKTKLSLPDLDHSKSAVLDATLAASSGFAELSTTTSVSNRSTARRIRAQWRLHFKVDARNLAVSNHIQTKNQSG